jgi:hypothetical protein
MAGSGQPPAGPRNNLQGPSRVQPVAPNVAFWLQRFPTAGLADFFPRGFPLLAAGLAAGCFSPRGFLLFFFLDPFGTKGRIQSL